VNYLAMDLESVPDVAAGRRLYGFAGDDEQVAAAMARHRVAETEGRSDFLAPGLHRIVGVGLAGVNPDSGAVKIEARCDEDEGSLIGFAVGALAKRPTLITYNGGGFDLPVLRYRALIHGLAIPVLYGAPGDKQWERYDYRYGDRHIDLADVLSGYGASSRMKLDEIAQLCGLGEKPMSGADVWPAWLAGERERIRGYVEDDTVKTLRLFLRWQASRGRLPPDQLLALEEALNGVPA